MLNPEGSPTQAQLDRAARLGIATPQGATKREVSELLGAAPPSEDQVSFASSLGIKTEGMAASELHRKISRVLATRGKAALQNNPGLRNGACIQYKEQVYVVEKLNYSPRRPSVTLRPVAGGRACVVAAALLADIRELDRVTAMNVRRAAKRA